MFDRSISCPYYIIMNSTQVVTCAVIQDAINQGAPESTILELAKRCLEPVTPSLLASAIKNNYSSNVTGVLLHMNAPLAYNEFIIGKIKNDKSILDYLLMPKPLTLNIKS